MGSIFKISSTEDGLKGERLFFLTTFSNCAINWELLCQM